MNSAMVTWALRVCSAVSCQPLVSTTELGYCAVLKYIDLSVAGSFGCIWNVT